MLDGAPTHMSATSPEKIAPARTHVLVVDDDPSIRQMVVDYLGDNEIQVTALASGADIARVTGHQMIDLLILDLKLPGENGMDIARRIRADSSMPIIMLTGCKEEADRVMALELGADDYLTKPVANADLVRAIETRLRRSQQQAQREFKPDFSSTEPLLKLGLTTRAAETLLWLAQGKTNPDIATILGITESTVKKHVQEIFEKLGVETRGAATVRALEVLNSSSARS